MLSFIREKFHPLWRLRKMGWYRSLQKQLDFPISIKSGKIRFFVMLLRDFYMVANQKDIEAETHSVFEEILLKFPITHVLDVGSNVGVFTWHALNINPNLHLYIFEPDAINIRLLKKTIDYNQLHNIILWEGVVSDRVGLAQFLVDDVSGSTGSIKDDSSNSSSLHFAYKMEKKIEVASTCLDEFLQSVDVQRNASIIKIDVEGAEQEVINGGMSFIVNHRPFFIIESFDVQNLRPLIDAGYTKIPLAENCNYLLVPNEATSLLGRK